MAREISQIRYTGNANTASDFITGRAFQTEAAKGIEQIGIQAAPGTKFYLNDSPDPIIIGSTGIYELDLMDIAVVTALRFDAESINAMSNNEGNETIPLLVDLVYKEADNLWHSTDE